MLPTFSGPKKFGALRTEEDEDGDEDDRRRVAQQEVGQPRAALPVMRATSCSRNAARRIRSLSNVVALERAHDLAPAHDQDAIAHGEQLLDLGRDEQDAAALGGEAVDDR